MHSTPQPLRLLSDTHGMLPVESYSKDYSRITCAGGRNSLENTHRHINDTIELIADQSETQSCVSIALYHVFKY